MRQFKFKEWVFKNLLPFYYQDNDTYHDSNGKGILQRFMEVCSGYLDTEILGDQGTQPGLDNIVDLIDVDTTPELFLNYLWEFLGEIPYAYGLIVQGKTYNKDNLKDWIFNNSDFPEARKRDLLKYAISLYKIRGTELFYHVLGSYYGIDINLIETVNGGNPSDDIIEPNHDHLVLATYPTDGDSVVATYPLGSDEIRAPYTDGDCYSCLYFLLKIDIPLWYFDNIVKDQRFYLVREIIQKIVEKYLPIHCKIATYDNGEPKVVTEVCSDFNDDFNIDFGNPFKRVIYDLLSDYNADYEEASYGIIKNSKTK